MPSYRPFVVRIGGPEGSSYPLTAEFQGLQAHADIPVAVLRQCLADARTPSPLPTERTPAEGSRAHLGSRLFAALFTGDVLRLFEAANGLLGPSERLRIVLSQPLPDGLGDLPWELVFDAAGEPKSLRTSTNTPLVRHAPAEALPHGPPKGGALRVLVVTAFPPGVLPSPDPIAALPHGLPLRDVARLLAAQLDRAALADTARRLARGRRYSVTVLQDATCDSIRQALVTAAHDGVPYHVVHFFGQAADDGLLLLNEAGGLEGVPPGDFAQLVATDSLTVLAVTLCQPEPSEVERAVAQEATCRGVPAVVAMQVGELDSAVVDFSREFYRALAAGEPLELALAYARRLVRELHGPAHTFDLPAVYMAHTGGLSLPSLERVHVVPRAWRLISWALATAFAIVGTTSGILDLPNFPQMLRQRAPVIRCLWPVPMDPNRLTIAFLPLTTLDASGNATHAPAGHAVADFLYQRFEPALSDLKLSVPYEVRSPNLACQLPGRTAEERSRAAADYARRIGADILVYGVITDTGKTDPAEGARLALAFNVDYRGYEDADEIAGPFALGGSLPVSLPFNPQELLAIEHPPHIVRMNVLAELVVGLSYLRADNPEKALTYFDAAAADPYWPSVDGKEFAYLLKGNALLRQSSVTRQAAPLTDAIKAYDAALAIKPGYTRAQLGRAGAQTLLAISGHDAAGNRSIDRPTLQQSEDALRALLVHPERLSSDLLAKAHRSLGYAYLNSAVYGETADLPRAQAELEAVTRAYEGGQTEIAPSAGVAYGYLAALARLQGDTAAATRYYARAVDLVTPVSRAFYLYRLSESACEAGDFGGAQSYAARAVDDARLYGRTADVEDYTSRLQALQAKGCPTKQ